MFIFKGKLVKDVLYKYPFGVNSARICDCCFSYCVSDFFSGAIFFNESKISINIEKCDFYYCSGLETGGIYIYENAKSVSLNKNAIFSCSGHSANSLIVSTNYNENTTIENLFISHEMSHISSNLFNELFLQGNVDISGFNRTVENSGFNKLYFSGNCKIQYSFSRAVCCFILTKCDFVVKSSVFSGFTLFPFELKLNESVAKIVETTIGKCSKIEINIPSNVNFLFCNLSYSDPSFQSFSCAVIDIPYDLKPVIHQWSAIKQENNNEKVITDVFKERQIFENIRTMYKVQNCEFIDINCNENGGAFKIEKISNLFLNYNTFTRCSAVKGGAFYLDEISVPEFSYNCFFGCDAYQYTTFYCNSGSTKSLFTSITSNPNPYSETLFFDKFNEKYYNVSKAALLKDSNLFLSLQIQCAYSTFYDMITPKNFFSCNYFDLMNCSNCVFCNISSFSLTGYLFVKTEFNYVELTNDIFIDLGVKICLDDYGFSMTNCEIDNIDYKGFLTFNGNLSRNNLNKYNKTFSCYKYIDNYKNKTSEILIYTFCSLAAVSIIAMIVLLLWLRTKKQLDKVNEKTAIESNILKEFG